MGSNAFFVKTSKMLSIKAKDLLKPLKYSNQTILGFHKPGFFLMHLQKNHKDST